MPARDADHVRSRRLRLGRLAALALMYGCTGALEDCFAGGAAAPQFDNCEFLEVNLSAPAQMEVLEYATASLSVNQTDCSGYTTTWSSSNTALATVDNTGRIDALAVGGPVNIRVDLRHESSQGIRTETHRIAAVTVVPATIDYINIAPNVTSLSVGRSQAYTAEGYSIYGAPVAVPVYLWSSSNTAVGTMTPAGVLIANAPGTTTISASAQGKTGTKTVTVTAVPLASITVTPTNNTITVGASLQLNATVRNAENSIVTDRLVTWSSTAPTIASVSQDGLVTGLAEGSSIGIRASVEGLTDEVKVTVAPPAVHSVTVTPPSASLSVGGTRQYSATARDAGGNVIPGRTFTWSTGSPVIASVSIDGLVTAVGPGSTSVTAVTDGKSGSASVSVIGKIAYAFADQPTAAGYTPDLAQQFNALGAPLTVARAGTGDYTVTIPGFGTVAGSRLPFVSAVNASDVICIATAWTFAGVTNATVRVECEDGSTGAAADSRFSILALAEEGLAGEFAFGYSGAVGSFPPLGTDVTLPAATSWSTSGLGVKFRRQLNPTGRFGVLPSLSLLYAAAFVQPASRGHPRCAPVSVAASIDVLCTMAGGPPALADASFTALSIETGRPGLRFAYAVGTDMTSASYTVPANFGRSSSGGAIRATRSGVGRYTMRFDGLAAPASRKQVVLLSNAQTVANLPTTRCVIEQSGNDGADFTVAVRCFAAGAAADASYVIVLIE